MNISKGLIIADPWIGYILNGTKTWEMRSSQASHRGWFGLIRKGTGAVYGVARLIDVGAPLSPDEMEASFDRHRIPERMIRSGEVAKWNIPWKLTDIRKLKTPVPYQHRNGAVTWVELSKDVSDAITLQFEDLLQSSVVPNASAAPALPKAPPQPVVLLSVLQPADIPISAADGNLIGQVEITQANIDHNHIYLRSFFDRFPADAIGGSNRHERAVREVTVDWGGGNPIHTDLDGSKRFFRARGWIRDFFELNGAEAGDRVLVEQKDPYAYKVRLQKVVRT